MSAPTRNLDPRERLDDPLIDEVREIRRRVSEAAGNDPARLAELAQRATEDFLGRESSSATPIGSTPKTE